MDQTAGVENISLPTCGVIPRYPFLAPGAGRHLLVFFLLALVGQNFDLQTKWLAEVKVKDRAEIEVVPKVFGFKYTTNRGIVFGKGRDYPFVFLVVSIIAVPVIVGIFLSIRQPRWFTTIALGLVLAGTLGNMYDRIAQGAVRDFIKVTDYWPLFNLADSFICVGVVLLMLEIVFLEPKTAGPSPTSIPAVSPGDSVPSC